MSTFEVPSWFPKKFKYLLGFIEQNENAPITNQGKTFLVGILWELVNEILKESSDRAQGKKIKVDDIISVYRDLQLDERWTLSKNIEDELFVALNEEYEEDSLIDGKSIIEMTDEISFKYLSSKANIFFGLYLEFFVRQIIRRAKDHNKEVSLEDIKKALE